MNGKYAPGQVHPWEDMSAHQSYPTTCSSRAKRILVAQHGDFYYILNSWFLF